MKTQTELCECCQLKKCECFGVSIKPKTQHTPTPWHLEIKQAEKIIYDERGEIIMKKLLLIILAVTLYSAYAWVNKGRYDCFCDSCVARNYPTGNGIEYGAEGK